MALFLTALILGLKILLPLLFVKWPFQTLWLNYILDSADGDLLQSLGMGESMYQLLDKSADLFSYVCMLVLGWQWSIRKTVVGWFAFRLIGQALYFATGDELYFFYFQNFLEPLMLVYGSILFLKKSDAKAYLFYKKHFLLLWAGIIAYKVWNEWYLHFANIDLSTIFLGINGSGL